MDLYIRLINGNPHEHPIMGDNFREAFPDVDTENLPEGFARFVRIPRPLLGPFEKNQTLTYEWVNGVVMDVWRCEPMTEAEKQAKIDHARALRPFASWTFNEELCEWQPPIPRPADGSWAWDEQNGAWVEPPGAAI